MRLFCRPTFFWTVGLVVLIGVLRTAVLNGAPEPAKESPKAPATAAAKQSLIGRTIDNFELHDWRGPVQSLKD